MDLFGVCPIPVAVSVVFIVYILGAATPDFLYMDGRFFVAMYCTYGVEYLIQNVSIRRDGERDLNR